MRKPGITYADAGVNVRTAEEAVEAIKRHVRSTYNETVLSDVGNFGGLVDIGHGLVQVTSTDGVGTKLQVAAKARRRDTVGECLVNHCLNDMIVQGPVRATAFTDYYASAKMTVFEVEQAVRGICRALKRHDCPLIGGETAEMPGTYVQGEFDLVGTIVGIVERSKIIDGSTIVPDDVFLGLASGGLGTNGYSLARMVIFEEMGLGVKSPLYEEGGKTVTVADALLKVHRCFYNPLMPLMQEGLIKAAAHITGGGVPGNLVRVLPRGVKAMLDRTLWANSIPKIFGVVRENAQQSWNDYFRSLNDGIGMILAVSEEVTDRVAARLRAAGEEVWIIGHVEKSSKAEPSVWISRTGASRRSFKCYTGSK